jgi:hypothetical protein
MVRTDKEIAERLAVCIARLGMPFKIDFSTNDFGVKKRVLNDPHYWSEDIYQAVNGIEHLIIC